MPAQDRVRGDHAVATQCAGQPPDELGEHGPVRPVQARTWVGAAQDRNLVAQHEELDVFSGGRATRQQDQPEHQPEDQVQQPQRHAGIMSDQRSPMVSDPGPTSGTPQDQTRAAYMPDAVWAVGRLPPDLSRSPALAPVSTPMECITTRHQRFAHARFLTHT